MRASSSRRLARDELTGLPVALVDPSAARAATPFAGVVPRDAREPAVLLYTSGTTGRPKGAELTHAGLRATAAYLAGPLLQLTKDDVLLGAAPFSHIFGLAGILNPTLVSGACIALLPRFDAEAALVLMQREGVRGVPRRAVHVHRAAARGRRRRPRAEAARDARRRRADAAETLQAFAARFGGDVLEGFGMTETAGGVVSHLSGHVYKPGSVGTPGPGVAVRIAGGDGVAMAAGEPGEVQLISPGMMRGYWRNPEATREAFTDGWFRTGDVGYLDADGYLYLVDRIKDVIMRGGYSVYPREVEDALYEHPAVSEAAVVGVPDDLLGEEVVAVVVARAGQDCDPAAIRAFMRERVAGYKYPRLVVVAARVAARPERQDPQARDRPRAAARGARCRRPGRLGNGSRAYPCAQTHARKVIDMPDDDVPVVIVGGSLVGLSMAVFLGPRASRRLVVERHPGTAIHPRAALVSQRTVELFRALGMQGEIEAAAAAEFVQNGAIMSVESLGGKEIDWYFRSINEGVEDLSPAPRLFVTQIGLEPILRRHAEAAGARLEYSCEAVGLEQDDDGVTVQLRDRDGGGERTVRARYVVAADGAKSPTRERLGIAHAGPRDVLRQHHDLLPRRCHAPARRPQPERDLRLPSAATGFFRFSLAGDAGFLVVNSTIDEAGVRSTSPGEDTSEERCIEYVRRALGDPDIAVEIENVQRWSSMADWAERLREGRVFVAGDAAHVMPPTGGFGGNAGVHDADNLAWKLAMVLSGQAGAGLLDATTPSAARSRSSPSSRPTRATCCGSIPVSARRT